MSYTSPTPSDLRARFPAFAGIEDATIQYWLTDATRIVGTPDGTDWIEDDAPIGVMTLAAHNMAAGGFLAADGDNEMPEGVTSLRSGNLSLTFDADYVKSGLTAGYGSTRYGREFALLLSNNRGGMRVTDTGSVPWCDGHYLSGLHPSW